ncbi:hypothetical protein BDW02DRAFT_645298 [Decorospora gaudefroyi]|uniref:Methyltransferase type 11 domain-containing protein n=1 Tax=Decorospora gaudefroyi TaxID=184978 RepID=A0A6A5KQT4_9PLEO|nr:hypothetical protein BDW02DRAFT_645298 [Decorospora gaudefroyi]
MFGTDLQLAKEAETVGARRERKARERSTTAVSIGTSISSKSSVSTEREVWWTAGLRKAKTLTLRPSTGRSFSSQKTYNNVPKRLDLSLARDFKDPALQPCWTYSSTLSPTLPSGDSFHLQEYDVPELEGDLSSRRTESTRSRFSNDRQWEARSPMTVDSEYAAQQYRLSPGSFVTNKTRASSATPEHEKFVPTPFPEGKRTGGRSSQPVQVEEPPSLEALELHDDFQEARTPDSIRHTSIDSTGASSKLSYAPFSEWQCLTPRGVPAEMQIQMQSRPTPNNSAAAKGITDEPTRFQRFMHRMEGAGPKVILDRLKEDWQEGTGEGMDEELALEKQLWVLTGFQMQNLDQDRITPKPKCNTGRILELYGNLSEVYQLSAMHPSQTVHFLTTKPQRTVPLPGNVSCLTVREVGAVPLPYPGDYFSHIRASNLPSLVASAKLPELFSECHKLLAHGGALEVRVMDAAPVRKTTGPLMRMWIEDRLSVNLERLFRCSKPCSLVPCWLTDVGFEMVVQEVDEKATLPCAFDPNSASVDEELSTIIGREFWKDTWGSFVGDAPDEPRWWWEDEDIVQECLKCQTLFACRTVFAYKK